MAFTPQERNHNVCTVWRTDSKQEQRLYWMPLIDERWWQHLHRQLWLTVHCPVLVFWSLQSGNILAGTETLFQVIYLELFPKQSVRKKSKSGEQLWRSCSVLGPQFRYIFVSDGKILLDLKLRKKMLKHFMEREKKAILRRESQATSFHFLLWIICMNSCRKYTSDFINSAPFPATQPALYHDRTEGKGTNPCCILSVSLSVMHIERTAQTPEISAIAKVACELELLR